jgi:hypothetical protein
MMELLGCMICAQPGATRATTRFSTPKDLSNEATPLRLPKNVGRFKSPTWPTSKKGTNKLCYWVSYISEVNIVALTVVLQDAVQNHANQNMGRTCNDRPEPAPSEAVNKYKRTGKKEDGLSKDLFQANFSEATPEKSLWNLHLADIFVDEYVQECYPIGQVTNISKFFFIYLQILQASHLNSTTASSTGRGTVHNDVAKCQRIEQHKISVRSSPHCYARTLHIVVSSYPLSMLLIG